MFFENLEIEARAGTARWRIRPSFVFGGDFLLAGG
jgi:hypothetical protein